MGLNTDNTAQFFVNNTLDNLELFKGSFTTYQFKPHFHETYTIIFLDDGVGDYSYNDAKHIIETGTLLIFNPYDVHTGRSVEGQPWKFRSMYIPLPVMRKVMTTLNLDQTLPVFQNNIIQDKAVFQKGQKAFPKLIYEQKEQSSEALLLDFLIDLVDGYAHIGVLPEPVSKGFIIAKGIREYIHTNYVEDISLRQLSQLAGLPEYSLVKTFKYYFQLPPHQYLLNLRIEKAKSLLAEKYSSTEVAYRSGFFDQSHFIRHFKKIIGITPKQFSAKITPDLI